MGFTTLVPWTTLCLFLHVVFGEPTLPFGEINVLVVTDAHSFIGGHPHEPDRDADYGDVLSFYQRLKCHCDENHRDLWFFMNGDWLYGTGLAMGGNATMLTPLLNHMPWDAINMGNHESYKNAVVESIKTDMIPNFGDKFMASNVLDSETREPFGSQYQLLKGANHTLLVFGFLYDLHNPSELLEVAKVEDALKEDWFRTVLIQEDYDAICVLAHMDNDDKLVDLILSGIREHVEDTMPVQFLTGHSHKRLERKVDLWSHAFEAGGYMDTLGFASFPSHTTAKSVRKGLAKTLFQVEFLNTSKAELNSTLDMDALTTEDGLELSNLINETRQALGLNDIVGCPPREYFRDRPFFDKDSIWNLWSNHIVPSQLFDRKHNNAMIVSSDSWRYDIRLTKEYETVTVDDVVAIAPFMEPVVHVGTVKGYPLRRMNSSLNVHSMQRHLPIPDYVLVGKFRDDGNDMDYELYTHEYNLPEVMADLERLNVEGLKPQRTGLTDTLYWIKYMQQAWECDDADTVHPWFENIQEIDEEATDGDRTSESSDTGLEKDEKHSKSDLHYNGYEGYIPPGTYEKYNGNLPPGVKPPKPEQTVDDEQDEKKKTKSEAVDIAAVRARRKKIARTVGKVVAIVAALVLLGIPVYCVVGVIIRGKDYNDMNDESFYDMKEMRRLQRTKNLPGEVEIT